MRKSISIAIVSFFVLIFLAKDVTALSWNIWYLANKEYVAKVLCVNKEKPKMHCNGKCHLAKQLQKLEEPQPAQVPAPKSIKLKSLEGVVNTTPLLLTVQLTYSEYPAFSGWRDVTKSPRTFAHSIFHPPKRLPTPFLA